MDNICLCNSYDIQTRHLAYLLSLSFTDTTTDFKTGFAMSICKAKVQDHNTEMLEDEIVTLDFRSKLLVWTWSFQNIDIFSSENNTKFVAKELSS